MSITCLKLDCDVFVLCPFRVHLVSTKYDETYDITVSGVPWKVLVIRMNVVLTVPAAISLLSIISDAIGELVAIHDCTYIYIYIYII